MAGANGHFNLLLNNLVGMLVATTMDCSSIRAVPRTTRRGIRIVSQRPSGLLPPVPVHLDKPSVARVYNYFLGGTTNWEVDRAFGDHVLDRFPLVRRIAFAHRLFLNRVVCHLMQRGIHQFLDIGAGVPSTGAAHEVADSWAICADKRPYARLVYVDNDPVAVAHTQLVLDDEGDRRRHAVVQADLRDPEALWQQALETGLIDRNKPVGLLLVGLLHLQQLDIDGNELGPASIAKLRELLPFGSYAALSHVTNEGVSPEIRHILAGLKQLYDQSGSGDVTWRTRNEIQEMLGDWDMVEPGWTSVCDWHPDDTGPLAPEITFSSAHSNVVWAGVAKKT